MFKPFLKRYAILSVHMIGAQFASSHVNVLQSEDYLKLIEYTLHPPLMLLRISATSRSELEVRTIWASTQLSPVIIPLAVFPVLLA